MSGLVPFHPGDLLGLAVQPAQASFAAHISPEYSEAMLAGGPCWTLLRKDGTASACGGLFLQWPGRAVAWAIMAADVSMIAATREAREQLERCGILRVECWVDADFHQGKRWARMLGFEHEGCMRAFSPEGKDMFLYSRVAR